jgi:Ca-activated chloride channel family protein
MGARVLVLITDGEDNCGPIPPDAGAEACAQAGVRVHTIALGGGDARTGGAPDAALLARIATATGGRAFEAGDRATLEAAWRDIDALERAPIRRVTGLSPRPIGSWLLAAGLLSWFALSWLERGPARVMA